VYGLAWLWDERERAEGTRDRKDECAGGIYLSNY
jgi:hypothetical protein